MKSFGIITFAALFAGVTAGPLKARDGTCTLTISYNRSQNPLVGGENTYVCLAKLKYADGREQELSTECRYVNGSHCYASDLPYSICVTSNLDLHDGYVDYADQHIDFNGDGGCATDDYASPSGDGRSQECSLPC